MNYPECYNNIRVVARFIKMKLKNLGFDFENSHLIGHSLGAHLMGYLAKEVKVRLLLFCASILPILKMGVA